MHVALSNLVSLTTASCLAASQLCYELKLDNVYGITYKAHSYV